jgi:hypothetical protein
MMDGFRQANIGIAVGVAVMAIGTFILRNSGEAALQLVGVASFVSAFAVYFVLLARADKRNEKGSQ